MSWLKVSVRCSVICSKVKGSVLLDVVILKGDLYVSMLMDFVVLNVSRLKDSVRYGKVNESC